MQWIKKMPPDPPATGREEARRLCGCSMCRAHPEEFCSVRYRIEAVLAERDALHAQLDAVTEDRRDLSTHHDRHHEEEERLHIEYEAKWQDWKGLIDKANATAIRAIAERDVLQGQVEELKGKVVDDVLAILREEYATLYATGKYPLSSTSSAFDIAGRTITQLEARIRELKS